MRIIPAGPGALDGLRNPEIETDGAVLAAVTAILRDVRARGDAALLEYEAKFDRANLAELYVTEAEIDAALARADADFLATLRQSAANIEAFHKRQIREGFAFARPDGAVLGQRVIPLRRVGLYVPGGTARYPSTVLMSAIPARLAGVDEIVVTTPPAPDGSVPDDILLAARVAGVGRILKAGGAQAVAALAYGTESVARVDKIVGPGNVYVATAKRLVYGLTDIDMIAGPSEILIVSDGNTNPDCLAADLLSQAEHDKNASAVLVVTSRALAEKVSDRVETRLSALPREAIARASIENNGRILLAESVDAAIDIANELAPEHLELCVDEPFRYLGRVRNAGSVFLGRDTPEALGDYFAGPNHTLPTSGTARFSSPLSVDDFVKKSSFIYYTREALDAAKDDIARFARREGLEAHALSPLARFGGGDAL